VYNPAVRALKSKNVRMTKDGRAKISDVGKAALPSATFLSGAGQLGFTAGRQFAARAWPLVEAGVKNGLEGGLDGLDTPTWKTSKMLLHQ